VEGRKEGRKEGKKKKEKKRKKERKRERARTDRPSVLADPQGGRCAPRQGR
jgi:hypothetical protein